MNSRLVNWFEGIILIIINPSKPEYLRDMKNKDYFNVAGISICVENEPLTGKIQFKPEVEAFRIAQPGEDLVTLSHYFNLPDMKAVELGEKVYQKAPWIIYHDKTNGNWTYLGISAGAKGEKPYSMSVFAADYSGGQLYHHHSYLKNRFMESWPSLSLMVTDQIWLAPLLPDRQAFLIHSAAAIINGKGMVFVGHSEAGKSTIVRLLKRAKIDQGADVEILCDDRNILRRWKDCWRVHGTWSHGDETDVSPASAPLQGIFFLKKDNVNKVSPLEETQKIRQRLLPTMIKSFPTAEWWEKVIVLNEKLVREVPSYLVHFDQSGGIFSGLAEMI